MCPKPDSTGGCIKISKQQLPLTIMVSVISGTGAWVVEEDRVPSGSGGACVCMRVLTKLLHNCFTDIVINDDRGGLELVLRGVMAEGIFSAASV
jgi:hypothetical protein